MKVNKKFQNRYTIIKRIGGGGMQDVYLACDELLEIYVVIKTPQPGQKKRDLEVVLLLPLA